jgi:hypothetical protein
MALSDDLKKRAHDAIKNPEMLKDIQEIASRDGITFNQAMQKYFSKDSFDLAA